MKRIDVKALIHGPAAPGAIAIAKGINEIMDFLEADKEGFPGWGASKQEIMEAGFSEKEAKDMRGHSARKVREWRKKHG